jgi:hypothetical protein
MEWGVKENHVAVIALHNCRKSALETEDHVPNVKIYGPTSLEMCFDGAGKPSPFLCNGLVGGVPSGGDTASFLRERCETGARVYQDDVLQGDVKPLNMTLFSGQEWVIQQDSVPAHKAKTTQEWLRRNFLAFISAKNWPSWSPDLNPLDFKLWAVLKDMACQKHHNSLKRSP